MSWKTENEKLTKTFQLKDFSAVINLYNQKQSIKILPKNYQPLNKFSIISLVENGN